MTTGDPPRTEPWHQAHATAVASGHHTYLDPDTGYLVFTELFHLARGTCCGSGCRHCPYDHEAVPPDRRRQ